MLKISVFYYSGAGNTKYISQKLTTSLKEQNQFQIIQHARITKKLLEDGIDDGFDTMFLGFPIYFRKAPELINEFLQKVAGNQRKILFGFLGVVYNLAMHNRGALKEEDKIVSKNGMIYYHIPITWKKPEGDRVELFLHTLQMLQQQNKKVFIHCIMNYRASVCIYRYKKDILKEKKTKLIAPKEFKPNKVWKKVLGDTLQ